MPLYVRVVDLMRAKFFMLTMFEIQQLILAATNLMLGWVPVMLLSQSTSTVCNEHTGILFPHTEWLKICVPKIHSDFSCLAKSYTQDYKKISA